MESDDSARAFSQAGDFSCDHDVGFVGGRIDLYSLREGSVGNFRLEVHDSASDLGCGFCAHLVSDGKNVGSGRKPSCAWSGGFYLWNSLVGMGGGGGSSCAFSVGTDLISTGNGGDRAGALQ